MTPVSVALVLDLLGVGLGVLIGAAAVIAWRRRPRAEAPRPRILLALPGGELACEAVDAAARLARAEDATVVPTVILRTPYRLALDAPRPDVAGVALELLEAVERRLQAAHVPVDSRVVQGRTDRHALRRANEQLHCDRMVVPAGEGHGGFAAADVGWLLAHLPGEILVLRPTSGVADPEGSAR